MQIYFLLNPQIYCLFSKDSDKKFNRSMLFIILINYYLKWNKVFFLDLKQVSIKCRSKKE